MSTSIEQVSDENVNKLEQFTILVNHCTSSETDINDVGTLPPTKAILIDNNKRGVCQDTARVMQSKLHLKFYPLKIGVGLGLTGSQYRPLFETTLSSRSCCDVDARQVVGKLP